MYFHSEHQCGGKLPIGSERCLCLMRTPHRLETHAQGVAQQSSLSTLEHMQATAQACTHVAFCFLASEPLVHVWACLEQARGTSTAHRHHNQTGGAEHTLQPSVPTLSSRIAHALASATVNTPFTAPTLLPGLKRGCLRLTPRPPQPGPRLPQPYCCSSPEANGVQRPCCRLPRQRQHRWTRVACDL